MLLSNSYTIPLLRLYNIAAKNLLDQKGFDPSTLRLQSVHSTDWATSPLILFSFCTKFTIKNFD